MHTQRAERPEYTRRGDVMLGLVGVAGHMTDEGIRAVDRWFSIPGGAVEIADALVHLAKLPDEQRARALEILRGPDRLRLVGG